MAKATDIDEKLEVARAQLAATLKQRKVAEKAVRDAEVELRDRQLALQEVLTREGSTRAAIRDLERLHEALVRTASARHRQ